MTMADVTQSLEVNAPRDRIWDLLTDPIELARWWPDAAELEPGLGGRVVLRFGPGDVRASAARPAVAVSRDFRMMRLQRA